MQPTQEYIYKSTFIDLPMGMMGLKVEEAEKAIDRRLAQMSAQGWELFQIHSISQPGYANHHLMIFRRPVLSPSDLDH